MEKRFIELGPEIGNNVVVERGLGPDERIIVEGFHKLSHGIKVAPIIVEPEPVSAGQDSDGRYSLGADSASAAVSADTTGHPIPADSAVLTDSTNKVTAENEK